MDNNYDITLWDEGGKVIEKKIRKLELPNKIHSLEGSNVKRGLAVDIETSGLDVLVHEPIAIGMLPFEYCPDTGKIGEIFHKESISQLSCPLNVKFFSKESIAIHGLTLDTLKGHSFDIKEIEELLDKTDLIVAHNSEFDRPLCEKHISPKFKLNEWFCTYKSIEWVSSYGFYCSKLAYLLESYDLFYDQHKAIKDCEALIALLHQNLPSTGKTVMKEAIDYITKPKFLIRTKPRYEHKDLVKKRKYKWNPSIKYWETIVDEDYADNEIAWLNKHRNYLEEDPQFPKRVSHKDMYSERMLNGI